MNELQEPRFNKAAKKDLLIVCVMYILEFLFYKQPFLFEEMRNYVLLMFLKRVNCVMIFKYRLFLRYWIFYFTNNSLDIILEAES